MPGVPSVSDVGEQAKDNGMDAAIGGLGITIASALFGPKAGPAIGGTVAGASVGGTTGDTITLMGMMQTSQNVFGGAPRASGSGSRGVM